MPGVKNAGEPCAREPHARFEVAAGGNHAQSAKPRERWRLPPTLHHVCSRCQTLTARSQAATTSRSILGAYVPVRAAEFIFARW